MRPLTVVTVGYALAPLGPDAVGGAEQIASALDRALVRAGHRSIVLAPPGSQVDGTHVVTDPIPDLFDEATRREAGRRQAARLARLLAETPADVVHLHSVDVAAHLAACGGVPALVTLHLPVSFYPPELLHGPPRAGLTFQFVSASQRATAPAQLRDAPVVSNGVDLAAFHPRPRRRGFALAMGRICPEKRFDRALRAAQAAGVPLILGGRVYPFPEHRRHFAAEIAPRLGARARFVGALAGARKRRLLSAARCLLVPSDVPETSSLVALEALASGTPVVAWRAGALPEIVEHGRTGFIVDSESQLSDALAAAAELSGAPCRRAAELRFSAEAMFQGYLALYRRLAGLEPCADDYIRSMDKQTKDSGQPRSKDAPAKPAEKDRDSHGTPFERVSGPGPKDQGKGAAGREAIDRVERNH